jgi:glutathione gamma-glutamylcysteinyltransferase
MTGYFPLAEIREHGLSIDELACLARCNGAEVAVERADTKNLSAWRHALQLPAHGDAVTVASYDRAALGQTGSGHFSPIGGFHAGRDLVLILDVARFKYPPHWVSAEQLWQAMQPNDPVTGLARGWIALRRSVRTNAPGFGAACQLSGVA